jgi:sulfotransferase
MDKQIFFQSSLPRAGSTLLQNIIGQNPDFYVTPTSGLLELLFSSMKTYSASSEFKAQDQTEMRKAWLGYCYGGMQGFFNGITDKPYVVDKSRGWGVHYEFLDAINKSPKIICMVRDIRAIYSSMEKNYRKNPEQDKGIINWTNGQGTTIEKRVEYWSQTVPVQLAMTRLKEIIDRGIDKNILFIRFEDLTENPVDALDKIYEFLDVPRYEHDFTLIEQITQEDDSVYGAYGDHVIKKVVKPVPMDYNQILTPVIANKVYNTYPWFNEYFNYQR